MSHHQQESTCTPMEDNAALMTINGTDGPVESDYTVLEQKLMSVPLYQPVFLNEIGPTDRFQRRRWLSGIQLPFSIMQYKYVYGNHLGTLIYAWRIPNDQPVDNTVVSRVFMQLCNKQSHYSTRAMRREFLDEYNRLAKISPMILRNIYRTLLHDNTSASYSSEAEVDQRIARAVLEIDDPEVVLDLRRSNGNPKSNLFDSFWDELQCYLDEIAPAVDERRHGDILHMPFAISIRHLREIITQRLQQKFQDDVPAVPSSEWLRLQFWPTNQFSNQIHRKV